MNEKQTLMSLIMEFNAKMQELINQVIAARNEINQARQEFAELKKSMNNADQ